MKTAIVLYEGLTVLDAVGAYEVLSLVPEMEVCFVATEKGIKHSDNGFLSLVADYSLAEIPQPDIILVPGSATHTRQAMSDKELLGWLRQAHQTAQWTTSVCSGALILGAAGLLQGKKATTHWLASDALKNFGAEPCAERFVRQDKIITAAGVSAGIDMALYLAGEIAGAETAQAIQLMIEYAPQPPFNSGSLATATPATIELATQRMLQALNAKAA